MATNRDKLRKAVDSFCDDDFVTSQDILTQEFKSAKNDFFKEKLGLEKDLEVLDDEDEEDD
jgi:hypothetical protein